MPLATDVESFTKSIGVQTHLPADEGNAYTALPFSTLEGDLEYLGVHLIRDGYNTDLTLTVKQHFFLLAQAGFKFDMGVASTSDLAAFLANVDAFETLYPNSIKYVEGPNEIQYFPFSYAGASGQTAAVAFQSLLDAATKADPLLSGVKTLDFTGGGTLVDLSGPYEPVAGIADLTNIHLYPANGDPPAWYVNALYQAQYGNAITGPFVVTEAGYNSDPDYTNGVSLDVQAKQTLDLLLDAGQSGAESIFLYELLDMYSDPGNAQPDDHWGLFNADGSPKPVAVGIHNLLGILSDTGRTNTTFTPSAVNYSISGLPWMGHSWLLEKTSDTFDLAIWAEPPTWNTTTKVEQLAGSEAITVDFGKSFAEITLFDPLQNGTAIEVWSNTQQVTLNLTDHPLILEFKTEMPAAIAASDTTLPSEFPAPLISPLTTSPIVLLAPLIIVPSIIPTIVSTAPSTISSPELPTNLSGSSGNLVIDLYRFFESSTGAEFLTSSVDEMNVMRATRPDEVYEGKAMSAFDSANGDINAIPIYRFFDTSNGSHFFTASHNEEQSIVSTRPDLVLEQGNSFFEHALQVSGDVPVYRFFELRTGAHFFTSSGPEAATLQTTRADMMYEGIAFYSPSIS